MFLINVQKVCCKSDLFATVVSLKYLLDATDFRLFYYEFKKIIKKIPPF